jgi:methylated-DNA-[protein]-cysteine S-methyltransferase
MTVYDTMPSPVGELLLTAVDAGLTRVYFERHLHGDRIAPEWRAASVSTDAATEILAEARRQLDAYFTGGRTPFTIPLAPSGTEFQQRAWMALLL